MAVSQLTFRIFLVIILIVAIIVIIQSSWSLWLTERTEGDSCACSGVTTPQLDSKRILDIITLLVGIALLIYAVLLLFLTPDSSGTPTSCRLGKTGKSCKSNKNVTADSYPRTSFEVRDDYSSRERFVRKTF